MAQAEFPDRGQALAHLRAVLGLAGRGTETDVARLSMLNAFTDACEEEQTAPPQGVALRLGRWVIRDEDLKLFATVKDAITPMAAVGYMLSSLTAAATTGLVLAVCDLLRKVTRFGGWLSLAQTQIVSVLKKHGKPMSIADLLAALPPGTLPKSEEGCEKGQPWTEHILEAELKRLGEVSTKNGLLAIVQQAADGKWVDTGV